MIPLWFLSRCLLLLKILKHGTNYWFLLKNIQTWAQVDTVPWRNVWTLYFHYHFYYYLAYMHVLSSFIALYSVSLERSLCLLYSFIKILRVQKWCAICPLFVWLLNYGKNQQTQHNNTNIYAYKCIFVSHCSRSLVLMSV